MQCRNCGTEIADKAIICYRCGQATTDPVRRPVPTAPRRSPIVPLVVVAVLAIVVYLFQLSRTAADPQLLQTASGLCGGAAVAVLFVGLLRRRR